MSTCNAYAATRLPDAALLFPEVAAFTTVADSVAARPKMFNIALSDVRGFLKQVGSFMASVLYGYRTYFPECHIVRFTQIEVCCRNATGYRGENYEGDECSDLSPEDLRKYANYMACKADSEESHGL